MEEFASGRTLLELPEIHGHPLGDLITQVVRSTLIDALMRAADASAKTSGLTEHGPRHAFATASIAAFLARGCGFKNDGVASCVVAAYIHDIGLTFNRQNHAQSGAVLAFDILSQHGGSVDVSILIAQAIGHHEDSSGAPVSDLASILILADKLDVHRTRVRPDLDHYDAHDLVNLSVSDALIQVDESSITVKFELRNRSIDSVELSRLYRRRFDLCRLASRRLKRQFIVTFGEEQG